MGAMSQNKIVAAVRFEGEDLELLLALEAEERLTRSDVIRRAVRAYAKQFGISVPKPRRRSR